MSSFGSGNYKILKFRAGPIANPGTGEALIYTCPPDKVAQAYIYTAVVTPSGTAVPQLVVKLWSPETQSVSAVEVVSSLGIINAPVGNFYLRPSGLSNLSFNNPYISTVASLGPEDVLYYRNGGGSGTGNNYATVVVVEFGRNDD